MAYSIHYYDLVLACIGASLAIGAGIGVATPVSFAVAIPIFGTVAIGFIGHALFVNGPVDGTEDLTEEVDPEDVPTALSPVESPSE